MDSKILDKKNQKRTDPAKLLEQIEADERDSKRGKLKIFFGSSAGVGKTYAMLFEAKRHQAEGIDVLAGIVETHQRPETEQLLTGLPQLPRLEIDYQGVSISEFDLDAALKRNPEILLVDELAHTNDTSCRHPKRWQDIEELLDAGIDVYTTLNVQHLESLKDVVESITGITVRETIPDSVFDEADDIVLVDISPDELINRLKEGKVYTETYANERALRNFFKKLNLLSLRELALRRTADYVDVDNDTQRRLEGLKTPNLAGDHVMVCIGPDEFASKLVHTGKRLAASLKAPWVVVYIETPNNSHFLREHVQQILQSAERNGAEIAILQGTHIGNELLDYAFNKGITKIVTGRSSKSFVRKIFRVNLVDFLIANSNGIDVHVVTTPAHNLQVSHFNQKRKVVLSASVARDNLLAVFVATLITLLGYFLNNILANGDVVMLYLVGAVVIAAWMGRWPAFLYSLLSVGSNGFLMESNISFNVYNASDWLTLILMFFAVLVIASQVAKLREKMLFYRRREQETQFFYGLTKQLSSARDEKRMMKDVKDCIYHSLNVQAIIWYADDKEVLLPFTVKTMESQIKEKAAAQWSIDHQEPAGVGTNTMPSAMRYYIPITGTRSALGVIGVPPKANETFLPDQIIMLRTLAGLFASALERFRASKA